MLSVLKVFLVVVVISGNGTVSAPALHEFSSLKECEGFKPAILESVKRLSPPEAVVKADCSAPKVPL